MRSEAVENSKFIKKNVITNTCAMLSELPSDVSFNVPDIVGVLPEIGDLVGDGVVSPVQQPLLPQSHTCIPFPKNSL